MSYINYNPFQHLNWKASMRKTFILFFLFFIVYINPYYKVQSPPFKPRDMVLGADPHKTDLL